VSVEKSTEKHGNSHLNSEFCKSPFQCSMVTCNSPGGRVLDKDFTEYVYYIYIYIYIYFIDIEVPTITLTVAWEVNVNIVIEFCY
jgi:hypothetical protein